MNIQILHLKIKILIIHISMLDCTSKDELRALKNFYYSFKTEEWPFIVQLGFPWHLEFRNFFMRD